MQTTKHTNKEIWEYQGPKIQEEFDNQTYFALTKKHSFDFIGFLYPNSRHAPEQQKEHIELIVTAVNNFEEMKEMLSEAYKELEFHNMHKGSTGTKVNSLLQKIQK
jgi:hypothetical protein